MSSIDWVVLVGTLTFIVLYGIWKGRGANDLESYFKGKGAIPWYTIGLSIMATQASAITFLSTPGQAYEDGMRFIQIYFGLPLAMVILSITVVPIYHKLKVYTAYEFLEKRFDFKTRILGALLFLTQRGLAAGLTILAPSIILSSILGWNLYYTNIIIGGLVVLYTVSGGTKAVSHTQKTQMMIIFIGLFSAAFMVISILPEWLSFGEAMHVAGKMGKINPVNFVFNWEDRYNIWTGVIGGLFLSLSYFGTDQSQVARYLTGQSIAQSRLGLLFNGIVKIPMQFLILFIGVMVFVFYQFVTPPIYFNRVETNKINKSVYQQEFAGLEKDYQTAYEEKKKVFEGAFRDKQDGELSSSDLEKLSQINQKAKDARTKATGLIKQNNPLVNKDADYVFLTFITTYLPVGLVGLLIAMIFAASMSSTSSELNALASTSVIDIYKRIVNKNGSDRHYLWVSRSATVLWGVYAIIFAQFASNLGNLIEAVNILGSLFYGTILGIFLVAFYVKRVHSKAVFIAAILAQLTIFMLFITTEIPYLWFNVIGCLIVIFISFLIQTLLIGGNTGKVTK